MAEPTGDQLRLAEHLVDLINTAWSLRARVADTRNLRMGFVLHPDTIALLEQHKPDAGFGPAVTYGAATEGPGPMLFCGVAVRGDAKLDRWGIVLALAPGDPE